MNIYLGINSARKRIPMGSMVCILENTIELQQQCEQTGLTVVDISSLLQTTASQIKYEFIDYISSVGQQQTEQVHWWASKIASKSNLQTDYFSTLCYLLVNKKIADKNIAQHFITTDERLFLLITENNKAFYLWQDYLKACIRVGMFCITSIVRGCVIRAHFFVKTLYYNYLTHGYYSQIKDLSKEYLYIYSDIEERSFSNQRYTDQYLPHVEKYSHTLGTALFCPYYVKPKLLALFSDDYKLIGLSKYSKLKYILRSIFTLFYVDHHPYFQLNNLSILWFYEMLNENKESGFIGHIHDYNCWCDFFRSAHGKILYPYENQPREKMMLLASHHVNNSMLFIAYQHSTLGKLFLPYHTTENELMYMPIPQIIVTSAEAFKNVFTDYYHATNTTVLNGGALRYSYSFEKKKDATPKKVIGCLLSIDKQISQEMVKKINLFNNTEYEMYVKMHPNLLFDAEEFQSHINIFRGTAKELYEMCDIIVYANSSSGVEAYANGLDVYKLRGNFIDLEMGEDLFQPQSINSFDEIPSMEVNIKKYDMHSPLFDAVQTEIWEKLFN